MRLLYKANTLSFLWHDPIERSEHIVRVADNVTF